MYSSHTTFVLGFHGCDRSIGESILTSDIRLRPSSNTYDWLGHGIYFWENDPTRALKYAEAIKNNPNRCKERITRPFALGAIIDLGHCLDLLDSKNLQVVKQAYEMLRTLHKSAGWPLPKNKPLRGGDDLLLRKLDCAVIEMTHVYNEQQGNEHFFDTVRGVFWEGEDLYENAGFKEKNHIQICVRNPNCIKGYFRVLEPDEEFPIP